MADREYKINVNTTKSGNGAKLTAKELEDLEKVAVDAEKGSLELAKAIDKLGDEGGDAAKALKVEAAALDLVAKNSRKAAEASKQMADTTDKVEGAQKKGNKQTRNSGLAFLEVSRAVEDAQYGLRGVLNNLPQIALHFGLGAGLAGAVSLAAVALATIGPMLGGTSDKFKGLKDSVGEMSEAFDDLGDFSVLDDEFAHFTASIDKQTEAIDNNTDRFEENMATRKKLRKLKLEELKLEAELEKQEIDKSDLSDADKILKKGGVDAGLSRLQGRDRVKIAQEEYAVLLKQKSALERKLELAKQDHDKAKGFKGKDEKKRLQTVLRNETANTVASGKGLGKIDLTRGVTADFMGLLNESDAAILASMKQLKIDLDNAGADEVGRAGVQAQLGQLADKAREKRQKEGGSQTDIEENLIKAGNFADSYLRGQKNVSGLKESIAGLDDKIKDAVDVVENFEALQLKLGLALGQNARATTTKRTEVNSISRSESLKVKSGAGKVSVAAGKAVEKVEKALVTEELKTLKKELAATKKAAAAAGVGSVAQGKAISARAGNTKLGGILADGKVSGNEQPDYEQQKASLMRSEAVQYEALKFMVRTYENTANAFVAAKQQIKEQEKKITELERTQKNTR